MGPRASRNNTVSSLNRGGSSGLRKGPRSLPVKRSIRDGVARIRLVGARCIRARVDGTNYNGYYQPAGGIAGGK